MPTSREVVTEVVRIIHFERLPGEGRYSIEKLFREVRAHFPDDLTARLVHCPTPDHSFFWLLEGITIARRYAADINHIVGDVHYLALGLPPQRTILTVHDLNRLDQLRGWRQRLFRFVYFTLPLRRCRYVTTVSEHTRKRLIELFPDIAHKVRVIPDFVSTMFQFHPKPFPTSCPRILQVGTADNKNVERVIEALDGVCCVLHIIGRLSAAQIKALDCAAIHYENSVGLTDDAVRQAYADADLVVFASLAEGFGLPILEAQATGRPLVTSNISPMKEVAGNGACLVNPESTPQIRAAVTRIMTDGSYRQHLIDEGLKNVERFRCSSIVSMYVDLYRECCGSRSDRLLDHAAPAFTSVREE